MNKTPHPRALCVATRLLMFLASRLLRGPQASWALAMRAEVDAIADPREALFFAGGCLRAALAHTLANTLTQSSAHLAQPQVVGVLGCTAAVLLGCLFMAWSGAPGHYAWMNALSLAFSLATFWLLPRQRLQYDARLRARAVFMLGALLLACSLGDGSAGASPWLSVGPVRLNLTWLLLPGLLVASQVDAQPAVAQARAWAGTGLVMAFGALLLQSDALMAGVAAALLGWRGVQQRRLGPALLGLLPLAIAGHAALRWQSPEVTPFVDQVLQQGFRLHLAAGLGLVAVVVIVLWPALRHRHSREHGGLWCLLFGLSLPGWLPSPLLGFGGSFILSFFLSLALLPGPETENRRPGPGAKAVHRPRARPPMPSRA